MRRKKSSHVISWPSSLVTKAAFGGIYITDLMLISATAFVVSRILDGASIGLIYCAIGASCIPLYFFLMVKNRFLPRSFFLFYFRKALGGTPKEMFFKQETRKWE